MTGMGGVSLMKLLVGEGARLLDSGSVGLCKFCRSICVLCLPLSDEGSGLVGDCISNLGLRLASFGVLSTGSWDFTTWCSSSSSDQCPARSLSLNDKEPDSSLSEPALSDCRP